MKYCLKIAYDGTNYHGFQLQKNAITIQGMIEKALETIFSKRCAVTGCSRTDAGVHAREYYCTFEALTDMTEQKLKMAITANLPKDISVYDCKAVDDDFHPRYDALMKTYSYTIWNAVTRNPFIQNYSLHYPHKIDETKLALAASCYIGTHDFSGFCSVGSSVKSTVRTVFDCSVSRNGDLISVIICADGFLYNMVRIIVGTLLDVAAGKISHEEIPEIILSKNRDRAGATAAAKGLCLEKVIYNNEVQ